MKYYYVNRQNQPKGPFSHEEFVEEIRKYKLVPDTIARRETDKEWRLLLNIDDFSDVLFDIESSSMGNCPFCQAEITGFALPPNCPSCSHLLDLPVTQREDMWSNFLLSLRRSFTLRGRSTRMEFWSCMIFSYIISMVWSMMMQSFFYFANIHSLHRHEIIVMLLLVLLPTLLFIIPQMTVSVRRLHDVGASGKWVLVGLLSWIGIIAAMGMAFQSWCNKIIFWTVFGFFALIILVTITRILISQFVDSEAGSNRYGPSRKYPRV